MVWQQRSRDGVSKIPFDLLTGMTALAGFLIIQVMVEAIYYASDIEAALAGICIRYLSNGHLSWLVHELCNADQAGVLVEEHHHLLCP